MKRILAVLPLLALVAACGEKITTEVNTTTLQYDEVVSVIMPAVDTHLVPGSSFDLDVFTIITGRDTATIADSTYASVDNPKLVSVNRSVWEIWNTGYDNQALQPQITIHERYTVKAAPNGAGRTLFTARSARFTSEFASNVLTISP